MKIRYGIVFLIMIIVCASCGCTDSGVKTDPADSQVPAISVETRNYTLSELKAFVHEARNFAIRSGVEAAAKAFNDPEGDFVNGTMYIYALDYEGNYIAHPFNQDLIGTNGIELTDANGMRFVEACRDVAESGGGYILYSYPNPSDNMKPAEKIGYVEPINNESWLGSGIYLDDLVGENGESPDDLAYVKDFIINASVFAESVPMDEAIAGFCDTEGQFYDAGTGMYVIAIDYEGNILAHPSTDIIGENIYDNEMKYGVKSIQRASEIAADGGGFIIYGYDSFGYLEQNLNYIMPVEKDDYWIISSETSLTKLLM